MKGGLFHIRARKVASFYQDICEAEVVEIAGCERRMDDARFLHQHPPEVAIREIPVDGDPIDLGAGSDAETWIRGQVGRKAGRNGSIAFETSHPLEDRSSDKSAPIRRDGCHPRHFGEMHHLADNSVKAGYLESVRMWISDR